jgi:tRNA (cytidine/uridine-2'-O-)-methyltransferase
VFRLVFVEPKIAGNTGNAIRLSAVTGVELHLIDPLGFDLSDAKLRRAGLDYPDLASLTVHSSLPEFWDSIGADGLGRAFAFTAAGSVVHTSIAYEAGDVLLFGPEPDGLAPAVLTDPHVTDRVRIPMLAGRRSLNLANAASIVVYEAWRQHGFAGT